MHQHPIRFDACSPAKGLVFSVEQMRRVDAFAIDELGLPGLILMEHASIALRVACGSRRPTLRPASWSVRATTGAMGSRSPVCCTRRTRHGRSAACCSRLGSRRTTARRI